MQTAFREQLFDVLGGIDEKYKVLVLGERVKQRLDLVCDSHALLDRRCANVQLLTANRQPERYLDVVYIVETCSLSYGCIQADFSAKSRRYQNAHVLLLKTLHFSQSELDQFQHKMASYIKTLKFVPLNFYPLEKQLFTFGDLDANLLLYDDELKLRNQKLSLVAEQLGNVCEVMHMRPYVRYLPSTMCKALAQLVSERFTAASETESMRSSPISTSSLDSEFRPTLLIIDRTADISAVLRHDLGFQALALDELSFDAPEVLNHIELNGTEGCLQESDETWTGLRHKHIVSVTEYLTTRIKELKQQNPHFADPSTEATVSDVRNMLAALPKFVKERDAASLSLDIAMACMEAIEKGNLKQLCEFEQTAVLNSLPMNSEEIDNPNLSLEGLLADSLVQILAKAPLQAKLRALCIYVLHRGGLCPQDWERLMAHSHLSQSDVDICLGLQCLGIPMIRPVGTQPRVMKTIASEEPEQPLLYARIRPAVYNLAERAVKEGLPEEFPYAGERPSKTEEAVNLASSLRNPRQRATWARSVAKKPEKPPQSRTSLIVFVLGGVTAAESASIYKLSDKEAQQILIGGDDLVTPAKYLDFLRKMKLSREELGLDVDKNTAVPKHLYEQSAHPRNQSVPAISHQGTPVPRKQSVPVVSRQNELIRAGPAYPNKNSNANGNLNGNLSGNQNGSLNSNLNASSKYGSYGAPNELVKRPQEKQNVAAQVNLEEPKKEEKSTYKKLKGAFKLKR